MPHNAPVSALATQVYVPAPAGQPNVTLFNNSNTTLYLGSSSVTAGTGMPLAPSQSVSLPRTFTAIWAVSGTGTLGTATTLAADAGAGTTSTTMTGTTGFGTSNTLQIGAGTGAETVSIATITGSTVTFSAGTKFGHISGEAVSLVSAPLGGSLSIQRGAD
jgi:hypothetical protein